MKILVIGASGLVGWNLLHIARLLGHEATGTYSSYFIPDSISLQLEDEVSTSRLLKEFCPDAVFCCAGWSWVDGCESDPAKAYRENTEYPRRVARYTAEIGSHFIYLSTSYVFDGATGPYAEDASPCPISVYGKSKYAGESAILEATEGKAIIVRTMGVYGTELQKKNFVFQVRKILAANKPMRVPNDQFGNVTYAPDLAHMAIELVKQKQSGIWNIAGPNPRIRRSDFARHIAQCYGLPITLIEPVETIALHQVAPRPLQGGLCIEKVVRATLINPQPWVNIP